MVWFGLGAYVQPSSCLLCPSAARGLELCLVDTSDVDGGRESDWWWGGGGSAVMIHLLETGLFFVIDPNGKRAALIRRGKGVRRWMTKAKRVGLVVANEREIMYGGWLKHASFVGHELFNFFRTYDSRVCCDGIIPVSRVV